MKKVAEGVADLIYYLIKNLQGYRTFDTPKVAFLPRFKLC